MKKLILFSSIFALLLVACSPEQEIAATQAAQSVDGVYTAVALTLAAQPAQATSTPYVTATTPATITAVPTIAAINTAAPQQQANPASYTSNITANGCYDAAYLSDVTIPDGTILTPSESFTKTWQFQNTGSCAWDEDFLLVYSSGDDMDGVNTEIGTAVAIGNSGSFSVELVAPETAGSYTSYWKLSTADGTTFGQAVYVMITVSGNTATPTTTTTATTTVATSTSTSTSATSTPTATIAATNTTSPTYTPTTAPTNTPVPTEETVTVEATETSEASE